MNILILGANGQVGSELVNLFQNTLYHLTAITRQELDCANVRDLHSVLKACHPELIINAAAYTAVDKAEDDIELAFLVNETFVSCLASFCNEETIPLIHLSTDYVFDGTCAKPYNESDMPNPQGVYARSKLGGEQAILAQLHKHIILRVSWVFGIYGTNFVKTILNLALSKEELKIVGDQWGRPTPARDIARVILEIANKIRYNQAFDGWGIYHYAGKGATNWHEFADIFIGLAREQGLESSLRSLINIASEEYVTKVKRPKNSVLNTSKIEQNLGIECHDWRMYLPEVITHFISEKNNELSN